MVRIRFWAVSGSGQDSDPDSDSGPKPTGFPALPSVALGDIRGGGGGWERAVSK
jgi:hypothetical protein